MESAQSKPKSAAPKQDDQFFGNWRTGNFSEAKKPAKPANTPRELLNNTGAVNNNKIKKKKNSVADMGPLMVEPGM